MVEVRTATQLDDLKELLTLGGDVSIAVAYVTLEGLNLIKKELAGVLSRGNVRILIALDGKVTDPRAAKELLTLAEEGLCSKYFDIPKSEKGIFHPKLFVGCVGENVRFLSGSYNLIYRALRLNREHGVTVTCQRNSDLAVGIQEQFEEFWTHEWAKCLTSEAVEKYERDCENNNFESEDAGFSGFTWPSQEAAFMMGVICARGKLAPEKGQIEISLQYRPGSYKEGKVRVNNVQFEAKEVIPQIRREIQRRAQETFLEARIGDKGLQGTLIDCSSMKESFDDIWEAYGHKLDHEEFSLPAGLVESDASIVTEFVRGYSEASGLIGIKTKRGNKYVVWLRPSKSNQAIFGPMRDLIENNLDISTSVSEFKDKPGHLYHIEVLAQDFRDAIGFSTQWRKELVDEGCRYNDSF